MYHRARLHPDVAWGGLLPPRTSVCADRQSVIAVAPQLVRNYSPFSLCLKILQRVLAQQCCDVDTNGAESDSKDDRGSGDGPPAIGHVCVYCQVIRQQRLRNSETSDQLSLGGYSRQGRGAYEDDGPERVECKQCECCKERQPASGAV